MVGEIKRQADEVVGAVATAAAADDIARYESSAVTRLVANIESWVQTLRSVPESGTASKV